jgi:hypothetical protein
MWEAFRAFYGCRFAAKGGIKIMKKSQRKQQQQLQNLVLHNVEYDFSDEELDECISDVTHPKKHGVVSASIITIKDKTRGRNRKKHRGA